MTLSVSARQLSAGAGPAEATACEGLDPELFFPEASDPSHRPSPAERVALAVCAGCPVRDWCLDRDLEECPTTYQVVGVRGGMRQADRRALHVQRHGVRAPYRAGAER
ncbi:WhiB family transcriptional regulator [Streptomyces sp. NPDC059814]|uniref:WhiB family transcriptional regulator n=1 Tax=Streptomyces sp. NPDC059814 TaxID=3346959 RepID=UPI003657AF5E